MIFHSYVNVYQRVIWVEVKMALYSNAGTTSSKVWENYHPKSSGLTKKTFLPINS